MKTLLKLGALFALYVCVGGAFASTWYIRTDGGTASQCTGHTNAAYPGSGTGQACALNHPFWLMQTGTTDALWRSDYVGGDIVQFEDAGPYYMGENNNGLGTEWVALGLLTCSHTVGTSDAGCVLPRAVPVGSSGAHTRWYGYCVALGTACHTSNGRNTQNATVFLGVSGAFYLFSAQQSNYLEMQGFEFSQPTSCTSVAGKTETCTAAQNWANHGFEFNYLTSGKGPNNLTLSDIYIHGIAGQGILGSYLNATSGDVSNLSYLFLRGNGMAGWDSDGGSCGTSCESIGTVNLSHSYADYNGCMDVNYASSINSTTGTAQSGYKACYAQSVGGYGDGWATIAAGNLTYNVSDTFGRWNVQDGFDLAHLGDDTAHTQNITLLRNYAEGNLGQTFKVGGAANVTAYDNQAIQNCKAMTVGTAFPFTLNPAGWNTGLSTPGDYCRASGDNWAINLSNGRTVKLIHNTTVGYGDTQYDIACGGTCTGTEVMIFQDNITKGYVNPDSGNLANGIFLSTEDPFANAGSAIDHNLWATMRSGTCPQDGHETNAVCSDPLLTSESSIDAMVMTLTSPSPARGAGVAAGPTTDYAGITFLSPPGIGAYEFTTAPTTNVIIKGTTTKISGTVKIQ